MTGDAKSASRSLNRKYLLEHPWQAAMDIERLSPTEAALALGDQQIDAIQLIWQKLSPNAAARILLEFPDHFAGEVIGALLPNEALGLLGLLPEEDSQRYISLLGPSLQSELSLLTTYPEDSAGRLMDTRYVAFRASMTAQETQDFLRASPSRTGRSLFLIDDENRLTGRVTFQNLAYAQPDSQLGLIGEPVIATVNSVAPREEVTEIFERFKLTDLPVVDLDGFLQGVIYHDILIDTMQQDATVDIQTMVGASKDERALSSPIFAVRKRLPWLQINLLTAFAAAAVVGLFESTIAKFTALAVLLPVVAGQSGNAGSQALAVTMRGLALREITARHWFKVMSKEVSVGFMNGVATAITCGIGVFIWSGSVGLVFVIAISMVLAMVAAGFAGALVPICLSKLGQDPAQASSIILTTVTDISGFFSFLGIAAALSNFL